MTKGVSIRIKRNDLPAIAAKLPVARRVILGRRGQEMESIAKRLSRVDTGQMRDGWQWRETNDGGVLENDVEYVQFHEYGTVHMSAAPMARPAAEQVFPKIQDDFEHLEEMIRP